MSRKVRSKIDKTQQDGDVLTGVFANDFPILCGQRSLPPIPVHVIPRPTAPQNEGAGGAELGGHEEPSSSSPSSSSSSSTHALVMERDGEDVHSIKKLHLRGFLVDDCVMSALSLALESTQLTSLVFWNTGLTEEAQGRLTGMVSSSNIKKLVLDANDISATKVCDLLKYTSLEQLSLKCCRLDDSFCATLSTTLSCSSVSSSSSSISPTHCLYALDLSCNKITDDGLRHLARALKINRTLISLGLSGNQIGDDGVKDFCKIFKWFQLTKEEEKMRKELIAAQKQDAERDICNTSNLSSPSVISLAGRSSRGSNSRGKKGDQKREGKKRDEKGNKSLSSSMNAKGLKSKGGGKKGAREKEEEASLMTDSVTGIPLLDLVEEREGRLWMEGNTSLAHLTLSNNHITAEGIRALTNVLTQEQSGGRRPFQGAGSGLLRVTVEHNSFPPDCSEACELDELLSSCDPMRESSSLTIVEEQTI